MKQVTLDVILTVAIALCATVAIIFCSSTADSAREPKMTATIEETIETVTEPAEEEIPTEETTEPTVTLYDVPLDHDLQLHIISEANAHGIDPAIIMAMAYKESSYNVNSVGDGGNSYGLLQIQPKWHYKRMQKLGCTDLLDPYQNVIVGIDYLCAQLARYDGHIGKALTAYNAGHYSGTITNYAKTIMAMAEEMAVI
jgi:soluble lytic murein transglycosylase-like protein